MLNFNLATPAEISRELGARVRHHRLTRNLRQRDLAERAGISVTSLRNIEREGPATLDAFIRVVMALGMSEQLSHLLDTRATSLKSMEQTSNVRQRAPRKRS